MKLFITGLIATLVLALLLVATAAAATVGGGTTVMPNPDEFSRLWAACLETRDPNSDECYRAQEKSGLGPDEFYDKLMRKLDLLAGQKPEPKPESKPEKHADAWAWMKECAATRDLDSDACRKFVELTGLNGDDVAKLADGLANPHVSEPAVVENKAVKNTAGMTDDMKACIDLRNAMNGKTAQELMAQAEKINAVCAKAVAESRLTPAQFWSKFTANAR
jgi:hypothetical protein